MGVLFPHPPPSMLMAFSLARQTGKLWRVRQSVRFELYWQADDG